jgi:acyl-CoA thioesterase-1
MKNLKIVAMGDSLTEGFPFFNQASAWIEDIAEKFKCPVINRGISGDTTSGMRMRFQRDVLSEDPTHVIILGGSNDAWERIPLTRVSANFIAMVEMCEQSGIVPILGLPIPCCYPTMERFLNEYCDWIKNFAAEKGLLVIDFYTPFMDRILEGEGDELFVDDAHPSIIGYELMGEVAVRSLESLIKTAE